jgi:hypothetical protein
MRSQSAPLWATLGLLWPGVALQALGQPGAQASVAALCAACLAGMAMAGALSRRMAARPGPAVATAAPPVLERQECRDERHARRHGAAPPFRTSMSVCPIGAHGQRRRRA